MGGEGAAGAGRPFLDQLVHAQRVRPVSDPAELRIPDVTEAERADFTKALVEAAHTDFAQGFKAGSEASARTVLAVAAAWTAPEDQAGAVRLFADMVAKVIRQAATEVADG